MLHLALLVGLLSSPIQCPKDVGQIRWDGLRFTVPGQGIKVEGSLWDRDRNGRPSNGDLMRIDSASRRGSDLTSDETWIVLRGQLARGIARSFRKRKPESARCESRFTVKGVPSFRSGRSLARYLKKLSDAGKPDRESVARDAMMEKVEKTCRKGKNTTKKTLTRLLTSYGMRRYSNLGRRRIVRLAREVAKENAVKCGHLELKANNLTF